MRTLTRWCAHDSLTLTTEKTKGTYHRRTVTYFIYSMFFFETVRIDKSMNGKSNGMNWHPSVSEDLKWTRLT